MKAAMVGLCVVIAALAWRVIVDINTSRSKDAAIQELRAKLAEAASKLDGIELQAKCAQQAEKVFHLLGYKEDGEGSSGTLALYANHHNAPLNKCFMTIESTDMGHTSRGTIVASKYLMDAYEQREYAEFSQASGKLKWMICKTIPSAGTEQPCQGDGEYKTFVARYME
jgi:hypothetical protein